MPGGFHRRSLPGAAADGPVPPEAKRPRLEQAPLVGGRAGGSRRIRGISSRHSRIDIRPGRPQLAPAPARPAAVAAQPAPARPTQRPAAAAAQPAPARSAQLAPAAAAAQPDPARPTQRPAAAAAQPAPARPTQRPAAAAAQPAPARSAQLAPAAAAAQPAPARPAQLAPAQPAPARPAQLAPARPLLARPPIDAQVTREWLSRTSEEVSTMFAELPSEAEPLNYSMLSDPGDPDSFAEACRHDKAFVSRLSHDDIIRMLAAFRLHRSLSRIAALDLNLIASVLLPGTERDIQKRDMDQYLQGVLDLFDIRYRLYCSSCSCVVDNDVSPCTNTKCPLYQMQQSKGKGSGKAPLGLKIVASCSVEAQLRRIVSRNWLLFKQTRLRARDGPCSERRDLVDYPDFYRTPRSGATFWLTGLVNTDGFPLNNKVSGDCWPVIISLAELPIPARERYDNMLIASCYVGALKPTTADFTLLIRRLQQEISLLRTSGFRMRLEGEDVHFRFRIVHSIMDLDAIARAYHIRTWAGSYPCAICEIRGASLRTLLPNQAGVPANYVFPPQARRFVVYRTTDRVETCIAAAIRDKQPCYGMLGQSPFHALTPCHTRLPDSLHLLGEGLFADMAERLLASAADEPNCSIRSRLPTIDRALRSALFPTIFSAILKNLAQFKTSTYHTKELHGLFTFPLVFAAKFLPNPVYASLWLMICFVSRLLAAAVINSASRAVIDATCNSLREILPAVVGLRCFSLKMHYFTDHVPQIASETCSPFDSSCSGYEAFNQAIHYPLNIKQTRGVLQTLIESCLLRKVVFDEFADVVARSQCHGLRVLFQRWQRRDRSRPPIAIVVDDLISIPEKSAVLAPSAAIRQLLDKLALSGCQVYSRVLVKGRVYTAVGLWTRPSKTAQHDISFTLGAQLHFGRVLAFAHDRRAGSVKAIVEPIRTENPFLGLAADCLQHSSLPPQHTQLFRAFFANLQNHLFWHANMGKFAPVSVNVRFIRGYCVQVDFDAAHRYVIDADLKTYHE